MDAAVLAREDPERDGPREDGEGEQQQQEQPDGRAAEVGGRGRRDAGQRLGEARGVVEERRGAQNVAQDEGSELARKRSGAARLRDRIGERGEEAEAAARGGGDLGRDVGERGGRGDVRRGEGGEGGVRELGGERGGADEEEAVNALVKLVESGFAD